MAYPDGAFPKSEVDHFLYLSDFELKKMEGPFTNTERIARAAVFATMGLAIAIETSRQSHGAAPSASSPPESSAE